MHKRGALIILSFVIVVLGCFRMAGCSQSARPANTIEVWHWMTDRQDALDALSAKYEQETGVKVKFELFSPSDAYSQKVVAAAQAHVLPDIYGILDKKSIIASFIKAGYVADLTAAFQANDGAWEKSMFEKALASNRFDEGNVDGVTPGIYGVPLDVTNIQMLYNKKLLQKAGINNVPATFDEFIADIEILKRIGVPAFVSGFGELWLADAFASNYAFNIMGEEKVMDTFQGKVPYTDPDWIKVFQIFEKLTKKGAFIDGIVTKGNKFAEQDFALERAAFAFNGSWCVNVYNEMNTELEYGAMLPPAADSSKPMLVWGGAGSSFVVNNSSTNKDLAIKFLQWLSGKDQQVFLATQTKNLPANKEALASIPSVLAEFAKGMDNTTHPTIWKYNEDPLVIEAFDKGLQAIIIGEKTPQEVAVKVQEVKVRQMKRAQRK
ncbi:MAG: extracellular solute-binding protein [Candidatus Omnitrophica bacterium]|nr:extracellular solute-binding protein [Candidatus Omnitrophota bacterium]